MIPYVVGEQCGKIEKRNGLVDNPVPNLSKASSALKVLAQDLRGKRSDEGSLEVF